MAEMNGGNFWNGAWKGALIGAASSAAGMYVGGAVSSSLGSTGFWAGAASGAAGGAVGSFIGGAGNAWANGASLKTGLLSGGVSAALGAVTGGAIGGLHDGLDAYQHSGNFWTGKGRVLEYSEINFDKITIDYKDKITIGEGMEYSDKYAMTISKEEYPNIKIGAGSPDDVVVNHLYANEKMPLSKGYRYLNGYIKNVRSGEYPLALYDTETKNVFLSKCCFVSKKNLVLVMGHEYYHAVLDQVSYYRVMFDDIQHYYIEQWAYDQAKAWNYHVDHYYRCWRRYSVPPKLYDFCEYKYWNKYFNIKY